MKIQKLVLDGYRGFRLRQIEHFEYYPREKTQVILGTNGSGKSSLLSELSPLPGLASDFARGGKKEITIDHQGKHYVLSSLFTVDGARYVFEVDGENLNPGHTVTVYRELCKQHFNYTPEVHALLTGKTKFRSMSVADRRNWFTKINDTDFSYAIKYHQRLKERIRSLQGALERTKENLTKEMAKCLTEKDEEALRITASELTQILNTLLDHRKPRLSDPSRYRQQVSRLETSLESDLTRLERLLAAREGESVSETEETLQRACVTFQAALLSLQKEIMDRCAKIEKLQKDLDAATRSSVSTLEEVQRTIKDLDEEETTIVESLRYQIAFPQPRDALSAFEACRSTLEDILTQLTELPRLDYKRDEYQALLQKTSIYDQVFLKAEAAEKQHFSEVKALEAHKEKGSSSCPKCQYEWYPNYDEMVYVKVQRAHQASIVAHESAKKALETHRKTLEEYSHFFGLMDRYRSTAQHFSVLDPYWAYVRHNDRLLQEPATLLAMLNGFALDLQAQTRLHGIRERLKEQRKLEQLMLDSKQLDKEKLELEIKQETDALDNAQRQSRAAHEGLEEAKVKIKILAQVDEYTRNVTAAMKERDLALKLLIEDSCVAALDEMIRSLKLTLSQHERTLSQVDIQRGIVKTLSTQIEEYTAELKLLKLAQKALSPTEGLIARGMMGFINHFVKQMNAFIKQIWLYPLELIPVKPDNEDSLDLDYRFSVKVNNDHVSPDVSQTSMGMQEVIDLAFVAISMRYLGLTQFPIFLDEFARSLDPAHRQSAYRAIDHLIESTDYSQVYLVSHYQDGYSSLTSSEVLVLCDSNVQMPSHLVYNKHATFA